MKKITTLILTSMIPVFAMADNWQDKDKELHLAGGFVISSFTTVMTGDKDLGFALGAASGVLKEVSDAKRRNGDFSEKDLIVTLLGAYIGSRFGNFVVEKNKITYVYHKEW